MQHVFSLFKFLASLLFLGGVVSAQDERLLRDFLEYEPPARVDTIRDFKRRMATTPFYKVDLNGDFRNEKILFEKNDGIDFVTIRNFKNEILFRKRLYAQGIDSRVHKIMLSHISPETVLLTLYYYEGSAEYLEFLGTGRLYFITIDNKDLTSMKMKKGPYYWHEKKGFKGEYFQRKYHVSYTDLNKDGVKDVLVKHHYISRAFVYLGNGKWQTYDKTKKL